VIRELENHFKTPGLPTINLRAYFAQMAIIHLSGKIEI